MRWFRPMGMTGGCSNRFGPIGAKTILRVFEAKYVCRLKPSARARSLAARRARWQYFQNAARSKMRDFAAICPRGAFLILMFFQLVRLFFNVPLQYVVFS